jgi:hypothetical protein
VHYKVRYRDASGKHHSETKTKLVDAERRKAEIEVALATATWRDPRDGELSLAEWGNAWLPTRLDLRPTTWARLETTMKKQVLPYFGSVPLNKITNAVVREWVSTLLISGLSAATARPVGPDICSARAACNPDRAVGVLPRCLPGRQGFQALSDHGGHDRFKHPARLQRDRRLAAGQWPGPHKGPGRCPRRAPATSQRQLSGPASIGWTLSECVSVCR